MKQPCHQDNVERGNADWPYDEMAKSQRAFARAEKQRFQNYVSAHNPAWASALAAEATCFDIVRRDVIEPAMRDVADLAIQRAYHVFIANDDALDRPGLLTTPAIRFYCSRRSFPTPIVDLVSSPPYVAYYGCAETRTVRTDAEPAEVDTAPPQFSGESFLQYRDVTIEAVRARLLAFIAGLPCIDSESTSA